MYAHALLLNADYRPIKVIRWQRAFILIMEEKADLITGYVDEVIHSVSQAFEKPAVVRLRSFVEQKGRLRFNRQNVLARDSYTCQYCGLKPRTPQGKPILEELSLDHVVPRAKAINNRVFLPWSKKTVNITCWENVVTACCNCNSVKADNTLDQTGLKLKAYPRIPTSTDLLRMSLTRINIPEEWMDYLPEGSEWRGYWTNILE